MTFNIRNWAFLGPYDLLEVRNLPGRHGLARPRLVARWQRGSDGRLECRWQNISN